MYRRTKREEKGGATRENETKDVGRAVKGVMAKHITEDDSVGTILTRAHGGPPLLGFIICAAWYERI